MLAHALGEAGVLGRRGGTSRPSALKTGFRPTRRSPSVRTMAPMSRAHESSSGHSTTSAPGRPPRPRRPSPGVGDQEHGLEARRWRSPPRRGVALAASSWSRHIVVPAGPGHHAPFVRRPLGRHAPGSSLGLGHGGTASSSPQGASWSMAPSTPACPMRRPPTPGHAAEGHRPAGPGVLGHLAHDRAADRACCPGRPWPAGPGPGPASRGRPRSGRWRSTRSGSRCW